MYFAERLPLSALSCFSKTPVVITGDSSLRPRVMAPLFNSLRSLGANIEHLADENKAPIVNWGGGIRGGECVLPGNISSQFITSIMFAAPFTSGGIIIKVEDEILSKSYIHQTIHYMRLAGISVEHTTSLDKITVYPGEYKPIDTNISGDMTSASYLVLIACLYKGKYIFHNANSISLQGERYFFGIAKTLGIEVIYDDDKSIVHVINHKNALKGEYQFDVSDCPNIIPTLAALGAYVEGSLTIIGGRITTKHKCNRIEAMITELTKLGVNIKPIMKNNIYDGFTIYGKSTYEGGVTLSSWGDHRIFMSLYIASLKMNNPNKIDGFADVICSFPTFFDEIDKLNIPKADSKRQNLSLIYAKSSNQFVKYNITLEVQ